MECTTHTGGLETFLMHELRHVFGGQFPSLSLHDVEAVDAGETHAEEHHLRVAGCGV